MRRIADFNLEQGFLSIDDKNKFKQISQSLLNLKKEHVNVVVHNEHLFDLVYNKLKSVYRTRPEVVNRCDPQRSPVFSESSQSLSRVNPESSQSLPRVFPESSQSLPRVFPESSQSHPRVIPESSQSLPRVFSESSQTDSRVIQESSQSLP